MTIPNGETTSVRFPITGQLDGVYDPDETVTITASSVGFKFGHDTLLVTNIDPAPSRGSLRLWPDRDRRWLGFERVTHTDTRWSPESGLGSH